MVAQYHDQGHIPIKLVAFDTAVNVSLGLPIDRSSVDHGTAFDIAGKGIANSVNLDHAIAYARRLAAHPRARQEISRMSFAVTGVYCAAATPVNADLGPNLAAFTAHCRWLLDEGCDGIALLGTTGEANSFSLAERRAILEAALAAGIAPGQLLPGTATSNIPETIELTRHAVGLGVKAVVLLPPFYYKGVGDDGLFGFYSRVIEGVGDDRLRVLLYHIPQVSAVPIGHDLIARLIAAFPGVVVGIKDSAGDIANMQAMIARFPGFSVLAGADPLLLPLMREGGAGAITATSNLVARDLVTVFRGANDPARSRRGRCRAGADQCLPHALQQLRPDPDDQGDDRRAPATRTGSGSARRCCPLTRPASPGPREVRRPAGRRLRDRAMPDYARPILIHQPRRFEFGAGTAEDGRPLGRRRGLPPDPRGLRRLQRRPRRPAGAARLRHRLRRGQARARHQQPRGGAVQGRRRRADAVIGFGGGSAMDFAKLVAVLRDGTPLARDIRPEPAPAGG